MKIISDIFPKAQLLLGELYSFEVTAMDMYTATIPYSKGGRGKTLPMYIAETSKELKKLAVKDFAKTFPTISTTIVDGTGKSDSSYGRLHDACYTFNAVQQTLNSKKFAIMEDNLRESLCSKLAVVIGDLVVFIISQFSLNKASEGIVTLAVSEYCQQAGMTPDVAYGILLSDMESVGQSWYAYEPLSPYCEDLNKLDPVFTAECEENLFPLSDQMAADIISGKLSIPSARGMLNTYMKGVKEEEVDVTPTSLISEMKLK